MRILRRPQPGATRLFIALITGLLALGCGSSAWAATVVFINELHYDNAGADTGEAVEVAGPSETDLSGWSIVLYNGNGGSAYDTISLSGVIPDQQGGFGTASFSHAGIQNGSPDGLALVDGSATVIQFLSYEGSFTAVGGPADGMPSLDIGVAESSSTPVGASLQLTGVGSVLEDFTWSGPSAASFGAVNAGQTFLSDNRIIPEPGTALMIGGGLVGLAASRRKRQRK